MWERGRGCGGWDDGDVGVGGGWDWENMGAMSNIEEFGGGGLGRNEGGGCGWLG